MPFKTLLLRIRYVILIVWFVRVYETISHELQASGYRPYTPTNPIRVAYRTFSILHLVHLRVSDVEHLEGAIIP